MDGLIDARVTSDGKVTLPTALRHRWGLDRAGTVGVLDLGDAALIVPGGLAAARNELGRVLHDRYEGAVAALDDPELTAR